MVQKYVFLTKNVDKSVNISPEIRKKSRQSTYVFTVCWDSILIFFWIRNEIFDFLRPSDSHLGQNWSFPFQIPPQRTNAPSPFKMVGDGIYNDETNNLKCNYDGGDCCGPAVFCKYFF